MKIFIIGILGAIAMLALLLLGGNKLLPPVDETPPQNAPTASPVPQIQEQTPIPDKRHDKGALTPYFGEITKPQFTTLEIDKIAIDKKLNAKETELLNKILADKIPVYDLSKITQEEIIQNYKNTLAKLGDDFKNINEGNLATRIKTQSAIIKNELAI